MDPTPSFQDLKRRLQSGDVADADRAADEIVRRFAHRLVALASTRLAGKLRQKVDPEDLVQSAFKSFFAGGPGFALTDWDGLWALLATITIRKIGFQARHFSTTKRNLRKERSPMDGADANWEGLAREPSPDEAAMFSDMVAAFLGRLDATHRQVVELTLQGRSPAEVATALQVTERTVYRQLDRIRDQLTRDAHEGR
jgi:RNA polymerase sigma-70 factor (ECF subfamily)